MTTFNKVCIIDDDPIYMFGTKKLIELNQFSKDILAFKNGQEALEYFQNEPAELPDLILLDINMPIIDGWQFLETFSTLEISKKISVFMVSSSIDPTDLNKIEDYPVVKEYLVKPIKTETLKHISTLFNVA